MYTKIQKTQLSPFFTPRFNLQDSRVAGIEISIKQGQRFLETDEVFHLIQTGNASGLLEPINQQLLKWQSVVESTLYFSLTVCGKTIRPHTLKEFLRELGLILPLSKLEIIFDCNDQSKERALHNLRELVESLPDKSIRTGLYYSRPLDLNLNEIDGLVDLLKLNQGVIMEIKENLLAANQFYKLIEHLGNRQIEIVVDGLYSKSDVTCTILMGIKYGQGYFLSRNFLSRNPKDGVINTLKKKPGSEFYERSIQNFAWI